MTKNSLSHQLKTDKNRNLKLIQIYLKKNQMKRIKNLKKKKQIKVLIVEVGMRVLTKKQHKINKYLKEEMEDQEEDNLKLKLKKITKF